MFLEIIYQSGINYFVPENTQNSFSFVYKVLLNDWYNDYTNISKNRLVAHIGTNIQD